MSASRHGLARHGRGDLGPGATKGSEPSEDVAPLTVLHCSRNVRPWGPSIADIGRLLSDVPFGPKAGQPFNQGVLNFAVGLDAVYVGLMHFITWSSTPAVAERAGEISSVVNR
jgi:hypothetical protein